MAKNGASIDLSGREIGGCRLIEKIGSGGMGDVYLAEQVSLGKKVALKVLDRRWAVVPRHAEGFLREARLAARLEDEHVVQIFDVGIDGEHHFIVMQLARGESLRARLKRSTPSAEEALSLIEGAARGLAAAHRLNIVHRDIKPGNLIVGEDGGVKILDFGLARLDEGEGDKSQAQFMGSVAYMAPEQSEYQPIDARTDIYALGITAYQCFTGQLPFRGESNHELLIRHHCEEAVAPSLIRRDLPLTLSRVVLKMMAKDPESRYQDAERLLADLKLIRRHQLPGASAPWKRRPLNPDPVDAARCDCEAIYMQGLKLQRESFRAGERVAPLREILPGLGLAYRAKGDPDLLPGSFLTVAYGDKVVPLAFAAGHRFSPPDCDGKAVYAGRFALEAQESRLLVRVRGADPLEMVEVQQLFGLLEWGRGDFGTVAVSLPADYVAGSRDVRWVVDAYNLLDRRGDKFALVVGSMENHSTFVNLGIDGHIRLELELEAAGGSGRLPLQPSSEQAETAPEPLSAAASARVEIIEKHATNGALPEAVRAWRSLVAEGLSRAQVAGLRDLRERLYGQLLEQGLEAFKGEAFDPAAEAFNLLIDLDPDRYEGYYYKGLIMKSEGRLEYAQAFLTQAILAAPDEAELFYHRAVVRSRSGDLEGALRDLDMALTQNPRMEQAYYNRARVRKSLGREDLALRDLKLYERLRKESRRTGTAPPAKDLSAAPPGNA